ncbi:phycobilisome rod-core linker polypeptide [Dapis sp. BLCC M126]|uniref:phycobilisome rod-core linker polypeptide n=1 Tax=Dapis sp. BLCC M126 TaxID=3400189 RepID=UPI003CE78BC8
MGNLTTSASLGLDAFEVEPLELHANISEEELEQVIKAVYKQVLGNQYLMEGDRLSSAESMLRNRDITVREFVRSVAQSSLYQKLFFESSSQYRFIELNFKHLLGRPPQEQAEISEHVQIYNEEGYGVEINSYIDSEEYIESFGENVVPYPRSIRSVVGLKNEVFNRTFSLLRGSATNDSDNRAKLITSVAANLPTPIKLLAVSNGGSFDNTEKRFKIEFSSSRATARLSKFSRQEFVVNYSQMSQQVQNIHKTGGKILSITEVA